MWLKKGLALAYKFINHVNHIVRHVESGGGGGGFVLSLIEMQRLLTYQSS